jgi:hypothetical protein
MPKVVTPQALPSPAAIVANVTSVGIVTATGVALSTVVPLPSIPFQFHPQQYTVPVVVNAHGDIPEPELLVIAVNETLAGIVTATGVVLLVVVPLPSCPPLLSPQQYAVRVRVNAQVALRLPLIAVNETPLGIVTATGVVLPTGSSIVVPLPSCPW